MKVVQKKADDGKILLECTASTGDVSYVLNAMQRQFCMQMNVNVPQGKTPQECAEAQMGIKDLDKVVEPQAIEALVPLALDKRDIVPAFMPTAQPKSSLKRGRTFSFTLEVTEKPQYELDSYDPVSITVEPMPDRSDEVDKQMAQLAENYATYVADDPRPVKKGDDIQVAMKCSINGEEVKNLTTDGRTYSVGLGYMPKGFDDNVLGMSPGETKTFSFEAPDLDDDGNQIKVNVDCTVTVNEIQKKVAGVIDDEWVSRNMPMYKNAEDLRRDIERGINAQNKREYDEYVRNTAASKLADRFKGTIPDEVYEAMLKNLTSNIRQQLGQQHQTWDQFVEQNGGEQQTNMMLMLQSRQMLRQGYALDAVFRHEGLVINDEDIEDICRQINPRNPKLARKQLEDAGHGFTLRESAERLRANKWIVEHADITVRERKPQDGAAAGDANAEEAETPAEEKAEGEGDAE